jgi:hypothetical protein
VGVGEREDSAVAEVSGFGIFVDVEVIRNFEGIVTNTLLVDVKLAIKYVPAINMHASSMRRNAFLFALAVNIN